MTPRSSIPARRETNLNDNLYQHTDSIKPTPTRDVNRTFVQNDSPHFEESAGANASFNGDLRIDHQRK